MNIFYIVIGIVILLLISVSWSHWQRRNKVIDIIESNCVGCGQCIKRCSRRVLEISETTAGIHVVVKYPNRCTACGDCISKCKFNALKLAERTNSICPEN
ncbi:MAG: 4Fe-4S binding protein [Planctomycetaceae bacterium]|nr:4Fe-4S binding protein [Planctomycetaceae bacterium]